MIQCRHATLFFISGLVWLAVGCNLLPLGLRLLLGTLDPGATASTPLLDAMASWFSQPEHPVQLLILIGLFLGFLKGRTVLAKAVNREIGRINALPEKTTLADLYSRKALILLAIMVCLGMSMKWIQLSPDIRGLVDVAVGAALINGAMLYFRQALLARHSTVTR